MKPSYLIQGDGVRLIPVGAESNKEARVLSVKPCDDDPDPFPIEKPSLQLQL